jgi:TPR repeat protein
LTLLEPYLADDPTGEVLVWCSHVNFARGDFPAALAAGERAAALGNADAMFELYVFHANGYGVPQSDEVAHEWLMRAAELGQPRALYNVGAAHATGRGLPKDGVAAVRYYERAAQAGNGQAAATLGVMYLTGDLVAEDHEQAARWFADAEEEGFDVDGWLDGLGLQRPA